MKPYISLVSPKFLDFLGLFSPLGVGGISNITLAPFIISRKPMSVGDETHEAIHIYQTYEVGVLGGLLLTPALLLAGVPWWGALIAFAAGLLPIVGWFGIVYGLTWLYWRLVVQKPTGGPLDSLAPGVKAYFLIPFEREAYLFDQDGPEYLESRKLFAWIRVKAAEDDRDGAELSEKLFDSYENSHFFGTLGTKTKSSLATVQAGLSDLAEKAKGLDPEQIKTDVDAFIEKYDLHDEVELVKAKIKEKTGISL